MLSILSSTARIAASAVSPLLNHDYQSLLKFRSTWENVLLRENIAPSFEDSHRGNDIIREFRRCEERGHIFRCLIMHISLVPIYYIHSRARYILLSHDSQA